MATPIKKVSVLLDEVDYDRFETHCRENGFKKSTLVAKLIRDYLKDDRFVREVVGGYGVASKQSKHGK